ncbi:helix-turn-helix domain-containing protein [Novosphingobium guangzhouense]|jgi:AraC-like DNA-binding protein
MAFISARWLNQKDLEGCDELCTRPGAAEPRAAAPWTGVESEFFSPVIAAIGRPRADGRGRPRCGAPHASADAVERNERCLHTDQSFVRPTRRSEGDPLLVRRLKSAVLDGPRFDAAEADIARELGLSGRTLRRRLRELGTTYAETLAEARFAFAKGCLADASLTIGDVADRAGYSDVSNFRIAFKRWASCSPRMFRAGLGLNPDPAGSTEP